MTAHEKGGGRELDGRRPSLLPFDPVDLVGMRVLPADLARAFGVSKQTVSQWEKKGWVSRGPDGRIDPAVAARSVLLKADPARMRARIFRDAMQTQQQLRRRIADLEAQLAQSAELARAGCEERQALQLAEIQSRIVADFDRLVSACTDGDLEYELDALVNRLVHPNDYLDEVGPPE